MNNQLNFTGGPWLLRDGSKVKEIKLSKISLAECWQETTEEHWLIRTWDIEGNSLNGNTEFDIMESLNNWKYNRSGNE